MRASLVERPLCSKSGLHNSAIYFLRSEISESAWTRPVASAKKTVLTNAQTFARDSDGINGPIFNVTIYGASADIGEFGSFIYSKQTCHRRALRATESVTCNDDTCVVCHFVSQSSRHREGTARGGAVLSQQISVPTILVGTITLLMFPPKFDAISVGV